MGSLYELAKLAKGRNCFVITSNTDQKLLDGRISKFLTAAPKVEGQEKQWEAYMNWQSWQKEEIVL